VQQVAVQDHALIRSAACRRKNITGRTQLVVSNCRLVNQHLIALPADLDRIGCDAARARGGEHDALVRGENGLETHGRAGLALRDGGDDPEAIRLCDLLGFDAGHRVRCGLGCPGR
jgi:hypothetical protein